MYISLSGNTESFVTRLKDYLLSQYEGIEVQKNPYQGFGQEGQEFFEMEHPYSLSCRPIWKVEMVSITAMLRF